MERHALVDGRESEPGRRSLGVLEQRLLRERDQLFRGRGVIGRWDQHGDGTLGRNEVVNRFSAVSAGSTLMYLASVSCATTTECFAVGLFSGPKTQRGTLIERWDGTSWSIVPSPSPAGSTFGLSAVSCSSATSCSAIGYLTTTNAAGPRFGMLAEQWDGTSWSIVAGPNPAGATDTSVRAVSCSSTTTCIAVGGYQPSATTDGAEATLAEQWDGTAWSIAANPTGVSRSGLSAVSCPAIASCFAVGDSYDGTVTRPLLEQGHGTAWSILASPSVPPSLVATLDGISCPSPVSCFAVGSYSSSTTTARSLVERWDGTSWSVVPSPNPAGASSTILHGVSCASATNCFAVGTYIAANTWRTFTLRWNGTSWTDQPVPNPGRSNRNYLYGVSCTSATSCFAVGANVNGIGRALIERWNGTSWSIVTSPNADKATGTYLYGVSCANANSCVAVGQAFFGEDSPSKAVVERWNGAFWRIVGSNSPSPYFNVLTGVSCTSVASCIAVGSSATAQTAPATTLIEQWNGKAFSIAASPNPAGSTRSFLQGASCATATNCQAVGGYEAAAGRRTLVERYG